MNIVTTKRTTVKELYKAIRAWCLDCSGWQPKNVRLCHKTECPLWPYRMGKTEVPPEKPDSVQKLMLPSTKKSENPVSARDGLGQEYSLKNLPVHWKVGTSKRPHPLEMPSPETGVTHEAS